MGGFDSLHISFKLKYTFSLHYSSWANLTFSQGLGSMIFGSMIFTNCKKSSQPVKVLANMVALLLAIAYTYAQDSRGKTVNFFFVNIEVKYLPYAMLLLTLVQAGPTATMAEAVGIPAAHLYDFLTLYWPQHGGGTSVVRTPEVLSLWFAGRSGTKPIIVKEHGTGYRPTAQSTAGSPYNWSSRGQGRRLGGE